MLVISHLNGLSRRHAGNQGSQEEEEMMREEGGGETRKQDDENFVDCAQTRIEGGGRELQDRNEGISSQGFPFCLQGFLAVSPSQQCTSD